MNTFDAIEKLRQTNATNNELIKSKTVYSLKQKNSNSNNYFKVLKELSCLTKVYKLAKQTLQQQKEQLLQSNIFLNMVIHDMRNPTNSISIGLQQTIIRQRSILDRLKSLNLTSRKQRLFLRAIKANFDKLKRFSADKLSLRLKSVGDKVNSAKAQIS